MSKIIGISGIGGSGKSTLTNALTKALNGLAIYWDDFDEISKEPDDFIAWYNGNRNYAEWQYDSLAEVLKQLKLGNKITCPATKRELVPSEYIIVDAPLGRKHQATGKYIDFCIFLNTPLDVALARRLLRDFNGKPANHHEMMDELDFYLNSSRPLYEMDYKNDLDVNLIIDGTLSIEKLVEIILEKLR